MKQSSVKEVICGLKGNKNILICWPRGLIELSCRVQPVRSFVASVWVGSLKSITVLLILVCLISHRWDLNHHTCEYTLARCNLI